MSLKALKESLQTCHNRPSPRGLAPPVNSSSAEKREVEAGEAAVVVRKPPKTNLREQLAFLEELFERPAVVASKAGAAPIRQSSWPSPCTQNPNHRIVAEVRSASTGDLDACENNPKGRISKGFTLQRCGVSHSLSAQESLKRRRNPVLGPVKRKRVGRSPTSAEVDALQHDGNEAGAAQCGAGMDEAARPRGAGKTEEKEEEEGGEGRVQDSEAGLFIQSESEGPYEPLVLWPPPGEGSSSGVNADRVVQVPASINSRLLPHQRDGVRFLYNLYRENRGGILGDDMGLGKTIQTIALLAALLQMDGETDTLHFSRGRAPATGPTEGSADEITPHKVFLILCPTSVLHNWDQEFQAWGRFRTGIYHGVNRDAVLARVESQDLEVVLTSHDMFRLNMATLCAIKWDCVIVDEAHRLKNVKSQLYQACVKMRTKRRYGLTGTIMQNKYTELFNVFDWAAPGSLGPREHFLEYYGEPLKQGQRMSAPERFVRIAEERKQHLVKVLSRHLLRRTKQETIGHLMRGKADNVVFCRMSDVQTRVYRRLLQSPDFQLLISKDLPCSCGSHLTRVECCHRTAPDGVIWSYLHRQKPDGCDMCPFCLVLPCLTKLQQVSNHLELIKPSAKDDPEKQKKDEEFASAALGEDAVLVGGVQQDESFLGLSDGQHCGKMRALDNLLATWLTKGDKVLLFRMLDILDRFMTRKGYSICRLDGSIPMGMRQTLVDEFNNSPSKQVFLISTRAGGLGLNLVSANRVVIFDPTWNPAQDLQAQDRSFRFGQRRHVTVYRLLAAGSIEELVYSRQIYKQQLFNIGVNGRFEKRYFEGVQDSKFHKGELFGISNLFRDLLDEVFMSDIIRKHDERLTSLHHSGTVFDASPPKAITRKEQMMRGMDNEDAEEPQPGVAVDTVEPNALRGQIVEDGSEAFVSTECQSASPSEYEDKVEVQNDTEKQYANLLKDAGVVYAHRNEEVVNLGVSAAHKGAKSKSYGTFDVNPIQHHRKSPRVKFNTLASGSSSMGRKTQPKPTVTNEVQPQREALPVAAVPRVECGGSGEEEEGEVGATLQKCTQQEEVAKFEEMDETSKWLLSASGFYPTQLMLDSSLL